MKLNLYMAICIDSMPLLSISLVHKHTHTDSDKDDLYASTHRYIIYVRTAYTCTKLYKRDRAE